MARTISVENTWTKGKRLLEVYVNGQSVGAMRIVSDECQFSRPHPDDYADMKQKLGFAADCEKREFWEMVLHKC